MRLYHMLLVISDQVRIEQQSPYVNLIEKGTLVWNKIRERLYIHILLAIDTIK